MKVLDVHPLKDGLHRNITMLDRLSNEMETIHRAVQGLVAMEESLKGEGGNAIRAFYADCHLPFLQFFKLFQSRFTYMLKQMDAALDALEPDSSGFIREHFLDVEIEQGLKTIAQLTEILTEEANYIMNQVADIVALPHLNDNEVQEGVHTATIKRDTTLTQLHEFDANQTTALAPIAQDLLTMETWVSDIEGLFTDGVTAINFSANQWAALSSKNTLKTELAQHTAAMAGLPVRMGVNGQPRTMLGALLAGRNPLKFSYGFADGPNLLYDLGILTYSNMATYGRLIATVHGDHITNEEQVNGFITEGEELSSDEVAQLINYLKNTDFDDPNRKNGIQTLPPYDEEITFEGMRKVVGGNGPGTPDGLAPYTVGAFDFFTEDIGTMLSADATANERLEAAAFTLIKPAKALDTVIDIRKSGDKVKDAGKNGTDEIVKDIGGAASKIDSDLIKKYIRDIELRTGKELPKNQIEKLKEALRDKEYKKMSPIETARYRAEFDKVKNKVIEEWGENTGQKWPVYKEDVISEKTGKIIRRKGDKYDAHHVIENSFGGEHEWWNMHPAKFPNEHQAGIHGKGSPGNELFKGGKK